MRYDRSSVTDFSAEDVFEDEHLIRHGMTQKLGSLGSSTVIGIVRSDIAVKPCCIYYGTLHYSLNRTRYPVFWQDLLGKKVKNQFFKNPR